MGDGCSLVLLPGLDGTSVLSRSFINHLSAHAEVIVVEYPTDEILNYEQLSSYVSSFLPRNRFVLVGESFSGPLALMIASRTPPGLEGVVLSASFARLDLPLKKLLTLAASIVSPRAIPTFLLALLLFGRSATAENVETLRRVLAHVGSAVLAGRAKAALEVDLVSQGVRVDCPVLYLQAKHDRLIPRSAAAVVAELCGHIRTVSIDGPHFLLQAAPDACGTAIRRFCDDLEMPDR